MILLSRVIVYFTNMEFLVIIVRLISSSRRCLRCSKLTEKEKKKRGKALAATTKSMRNLRKELAYYKNENL